MNQLLHILLHIMSLTCCLCISAMNTTQRRGTVLAERALNIIEIYNGKNIGEASIDPDQYMKWLEEVPLHNRSSDSALSPELHKKMASIALSTLYRTICLEPFALASHYSNEAIIHKTALALYAKSIQYGKENLKPVWLPLKKQFNPERLNSILDTLLASASDIDYWKRRRLLIATLIYAGADVNRTRQRDAMSILGQAVLYDDVSTALLLLRYKANPNARFTQELQAPLIWHANSPAMVQVLINYGAQLPSIRKDCTLSDCDGERYEELRDIFHQYNRHVAQDND
jgi:hypothetical protein